MIIRNHILLVFLDGIYLVMQIVSAQISIHQQDSGQTLRFPVP